MRNLFGPAVPTQALTFVPDLAALKTQLVIEQDCWHRMRANYPEHARGEEVVREMDLCLSRAQVIAELIVENYHDLPD